jgi:hypothetical protein
MQEPGSQGARALGAIMGYFAPPICICTLSPKLPAAYAYALKAQCWESEDLRSKKIPGLAGEGGRGRVSPPDWS